MFGVLSASLVACSDSSGEPKDEAADVYSAIIRQLLVEQDSATSPGSPAGSQSSRGDTAAQSLRSVFVEPLGDGYVIDLTVQARVVKTLKALAEVRFIDNRAEAVEKDEPGEPVRNEGMLVGLGPLVQAADRQRTVPVRRYLGPKDHEDLLVTVTASGEDWLVVLAEVP